MNTFARDETSTLEGDKQGSHINDRNNPNTQTWAFQIKRLRKTTLLVGAHPLYTRLYHDWVTITTTTAAKRLSKCVVVLITSRKSYNHLPKQGFVLNRRKATVSNAFSFFAYHLAVCHFYNKTSFPSKRQGALHYTASLWNTLSRRPATGFEDFGRLVAINRPFYRYIC